MQTPNQTEHWTVLQYSRFKPDSKLQAPAADASGGTKGEWIDYDGDANKKIRLSFTLEGHLLVTKEQEVYESILLSTSSLNSRSCKVLHKKDSIMFLYKVQKESRMFKVKFSGSDVCDANNSCKTCAQALAKYVNVRFAEIDQRNLDGANWGFMKSVEPNIAQLVKTIMNKESNKLPLVYKQCSSNRAIDKAGLEQMVMLCFTDPNFPSFVGEVEKIIQKVVKDKEIGTENV